MPRVHNQEVLQKMQQHTNNDRVNMVQRGISIVAGCLSVALADLTFYLNKS